MGEMTPAMKRALDRLHDSEDGEIVCDGLACYIDETRIAWRTVNALLRLLALRDVSDVKGARRFTMNEVGETLRRRPDLAPELSAAISRGISFTIADDKIVEMEPPFEDRADG